MPSKVPLRLPARHRDLQPVLDVLQRDIIAVNESLAQIANQTATTAQATAEAAQATAEAAQSTASSGGLVASQTFFLSWEVL